jgi:hypothetical protein
MASNFDGIQSTSADDEADADLVASGPLTVDDR